MKVTRKRTGYTIQCSDGEYEAIKALTEAPGAAKQLTGKARGGHTRRTKGGAFMRIDVDNRGRAYRNPGTLVK